jgi:hypothetical protein
MIDLLRDREWDDLTCEQREEWIARYLATRGGGGYERPLSDTEVEMKILLSTPSTISRVRRAASAVDALGSSSQSIPR